MEIRLVHQYGSVRCGIDDAQQFVTTGCLAGGTVGIGDGDKARRRGDRVEQRGSRETEPVFRRNVNDLRRRARRVDLIHGVGGDREQDLSARIEVGLAQNVDGFVDAIG